MFKLLRALLSERRGPLNKLGESPTILEARHHDLMALNALLAEHVGFSTLAALPEEFTSMYMEVVFARARVSISAHLTVEGVLGGTVYFGGDVPGRGYTMYPMSVTVSRTSEDGTAIDMDIALTSQARKIGVDEEIAKSVAADAVKVVYIMAWAMRLGMVTPEVSVTHSVEADVRHYSQGSHSAAPQQPRAFSFRYQKAHLLKQVEVLKAKPIVVRRLDGVALHSVREHFRRLGSGKVIRVRAHLRGDPEKGFVCHEATKVVEATCIVD